MRFRLLVIMMKACLDECPMGNFRKQAIIRNAQELQRNLSSLPCIHLQAERYADLESTTESIHGFNERFKLLLVMAKSFAGGYPIGAFRRLAISNTLSAITQDMGIDDKAPMDWCVNVA